MLDLHIGYGLGRPEIVCVSESKQEIVVLKEGSSDINRLYLIIEQLPKHHREVLLLYLEGDKHQVIAGKLGVSEREAKQRVEAACNYLHKCSGNLWGMAMAGLIQLL